MAIQALYPDTRPTLNLNFARAKRLDPRITFSRLSTGTYIGSDGLLKTAIANVARFDHDSITGESLGLLMEESRTNLVLHNRDLTQGQWTKSNATVARNQTGPDGIGNSASSIIADADRATVLQAITSASSARLTSAYIKRISGTGPIEMTQNGGLNWTAVPITASWVRVSIPSATILNPTVGFRLGAIGDAIAVDYVQCENDSFPTSAIATTSATVTRAADVASITGSSFSSWYNNTEGTFVTDAILAYTQNAGNPFAFGGVFYTAINNQVDQVRTLGNATLMYGLSISLTSFSKTAVALKSGDFAVGVNGSITGSSSTVYTPTGTQWAINSSLGSLGRIKRLAYYPVRLPNAQLQVLTAA